MSKYIYFTPEEKARAQNTDLVSLLRAQGERPVRSGREFRTPNDPSITVRGNKWFDHSKREGGYAVSFAQRYYRLPYQEAVLLLLGRKIKPSNLFVFCAVVRYCCINHINCISYWNVVHIFISF